MENRHEQSQKHNESVDVKTENNESIEEKLTSIFKERVEKNKKDSTFDSGRNFAIGQKKHFT